MVKLLGYHNSLDVPESQLGRAEEQLAALILAQMQEKAFEGLPVKEGKLSPIQFETAIKCGVRLSFVWPQLLR